MQLQNIIANRNGRLVVTGLSVLFLLPIALPLAARQVAAKPNDVRKRLGQSGSASASVAQAKPKPAPAAPVKPLTNTPMKPSMNPPMASKASTAPRPAAKVPAETKAPALAKAPVAAQKAPKPTAEAELKAVADQSSGSRRDPFEPLVGREKNGPVAANLPPGKAGLQIATLRLDGLVRSPNGTIAIVSNPQQRVYFLRDGDRLFDGDVEHITMEGASFRQTGTDPFGKPVEREVTKQLSGTPGEAK